MTETSKVIQTLLSLLQFPSETGNEAAIMQYVQKECDSLTVLEKIRIGNSLIYFGPCEREKPTLILYGHLDTVTNQQEKEPCIEGDKIYGCGASDMKGGLAVMLEIMKELKAVEAPPFNLGFVFYDKEEGPYEENGLGPVLNEVSRLRDCDLAIILEPTQNHIQMGCLGSLHAQVTYRGKSAHSARPWEGDNALHQGGELLTRLASLAPKEVDFEGLKFFEVINATVAKAGTTRNSIPGKFELNLNYRFAPGKTIEQAKKELYELVEQRAEVVFTDECPSGPTVLDNPVLTQFQNSYNLTIEAKQAWTDIARLGIYHIPAINFGPGESSQAHQKNEWISSTTLLENYRILHSFLLGCPPHV